MYNEESAKYPSGSVGSYGASLSNVPVKESPTARELSILAKTVAEITMLSEDLLRRLAPVLSNQPEAGANVDTKQDSLAEVPAQIRQNHQNLSQPMYNLKSILSRLEI